MIRRLLLSLLLSFSLEAGAARCVYAVGDIHGDFDALLAILVEAKLVDPETGAWSGGACEIYFLGDMVSRWHHGRFVLEYTTWLEPQARAMGGKLVRLLGNHELMILQGNDKFVTEEDKEHWSVGTRLLETPWQAYVRQFRDRESPFGREISERPGAVRVNRSLLLHGGMTRRALGVSLGRLNRLVREKLVLPLQNRETPGSDSRVYELLWDRSLAEGEQPVSTVDALLAHFDVDQIVLGHTANEAGGIENRYDGKVIRADARLSRAMDNPFNLLWFLRLDPNGGVTRMNAVRPRGEHPLRAKLLQPARRLEWSPWSCVRNLVQ